MKIGNSAESKIAARTGHVRRVVLHGRHEDADGHRDASHVSRRRRREATAASAALVTDVAQLIVTHEAVGIKLEAVGLRRAAVVGAARDQNLTRVEHGRAHEATALNKNTNHT